MNPNKETTKIAASQCPVPVDSKPSLPVKVDISPEDMCKALQLRHENRLTVREPILPDVVKPSLGNNQQGVYKEPIRLNFDDEIEPGRRRMHSGASGRLVGRAVGAVLATASMAAHEKVREAENENSAVKGAHKAETMTELSVRSAARYYTRKQAGRRNRLRDEPLHSQRQRHQTGKKPNQFGSNGTHTEKGEPSKTDTKHDAKKLQQKARIKQEYQLAARSKIRGGASAASKGVKAAAGKADKVKEVITAFCKNHKGLFIALAILGILFILMLIGLGSCSSMLAGSSTPLITTTYPSTDEAMRDTENAYASFEADLREQISRIPEDYPGYATYQYNLCEITHNAYHLVSYFSAKYGNYTYDSVASEIEEIFRQQYSLSQYFTSEVIEHRKIIYEGDPPTAVEVVTYETIHHLHITLTDNGLDMVLRSRMTPEEQELYDLYNMTYGNRPELFPNGTP